MKRLCKHCYKEHDLFYFKHYKNMMVHLVILCDLKHSYIYLPYEKHLPIPLKLSSKFRDKEAESIPLPMA